MKTIRKISRSLSAPVAMVMFLSVGPIPAAQAAMVSTERFISQSEATVDRERVLNLLARDDVRTQMEALGVDPAQAAERVAGLSDGEVQQIVDRLDEMPAGQDAAGAIIGAVLAVFVILLITDILCLTTFYPFTKCVTAK